MKITVLTYLDSDDENSKEYDPVVPQVARMLRRLGHRVSILGVHGDVKRLIGGLSRRRPDLVFNLMEMFGNNVFGDIPVTGLLELLGVRYTGSGPGELVAQRGDVINVDVEPHAPLPSNYLVNLKVVPVMRRLAVLVALVSSAYLGDGGGGSEWQAVRAVDPEGRRLVPRLCAAAFAG